MLDLITYIFYFEDLENLHVILYLLFPYIISYYLHKKKLIKSLFLTKFSAFLSSYKLSITKIIIFIRSWYSLAVNLAIDFNPFVKTFKPINLGILANQ